MKALRKILVIACVIALAAFGAACVRQEERKRRRPGAVAAVRSTSR